MPAYDVIRGLVPKPVVRVAKAAGRKVSATRKWLRRRRHRPNVFRIDTPERVGIIFDAPSEMSTTERLFLYAFVRGQRPERILEIGSRHGGSASIMAAALEDSQRGNEKTPGRIIGIDPGPKITVPQRNFFGRFALIEKFSPQAIPEARELAGGPFNLVLIDGLHIYTQAVKDIEGVLPHLAEDAYLLFHDAFHYGLSQAIAEALRANTNLIDCGYACARPAAMPLLAYGGLRLLRFASSAIMDPQPTIEREYAKQKKQPPQRDPELLDHDEWYCRVHHPCAHCQRAASNASNTHPIASSDSGK